MDRSNPWKTLVSRIVYKNTWLVLREDKVIRPDGNEGIYSVVEIRPSVAIVAINDTDEIALVGQWRYTHNKYSWEIPMGSSRQTDATILDAAKRELEEETGLRAQKWLSLGTIDNCNGATTDVANLFLASILSQHIQRQDPEECLSVQWVPFSKAVCMVMEGTITESGSVAAILKTEKLRLSAT